MRIECGEVTLTLKSSWMWRADSRDKVAKKLQLIDCSVLINALTCSSGDFTHAGRHREAYVPKSDF